MELIKLSKKIPVTSQEIPLSLEEKFECEPHSFFPNCPKDAKNELEKLIDLRLTNMQFFPIGGWETIKGINQTTNQSEYKTLIKNQMQCESKAYKSYLSR